MTKDVFSKLKSNSYTWIRIWIQQLKFMQIHAYLDTDSEPQPCFLSVLLTRDPVLFLGSGSGMKKNQIQNPESRMNIPELIFENFYNFWIKNT